jgi:hypothetical protein
MCHGHEKLQEQELNQGHNKEKKSQKITENASLKLTQDYKHK